MGRGPGDASTSGASDRLGQSRRSVAHPARSCHGVNSVGAPFQRSGSSQADGGVEFGRLGWNGLGARVDGGRRENPRAGLGGTMLVRSTSRILVIVTAFLACLSSLPAPALGALYDPGAWTHAMDGGDGTPVSVPTAVTGKLPETTGSSASAKVTYDAYYSISPYVGSAAGGTTVSGARLSFDRCVAPFTCLGGSGERATPTGWVAWLLSVEACGRRRPALDRRRGRPSHRGRRSDPSTAERAGLAQRRAPERRRCHTIPHLTPKKKRNP